MPTAEIQGELWGAKARDWTYKTEPCSIPLWTAILDAAKVGANTKLLDIGCGGGGLAVLAAQRGAEIYGLDASRALLDISSERVPKGTFEIGDSQALPFKNATFDVVTACNCIQFVEDQRKAVMEAKRVLKPGGKFAIGMWCEMDRSDMRFIFQAVGSVAPPTPPKANEPPTLAVKENLVALVESGGFRVVGGEDINSPIIYPNAEEAWQAVRSAGVIEAVARSTGEDKLRHAVMNAMEPFIKSDGSIFLQNCFRYLLCE